MSWAVFALAAVTLWSMVNVMDKLVMTHFFKTPKLPVFVAAVVGVITASGVGLIRGYGDVAWPHAVIGIGAGMAACFASYLYFRGIARDEISRLAPFLYFVPLFVAVIAAIFLGEIFPPLAYLGIALLVGGAVLLTYRGATVTLWRPALLVIAGAFLWAITQVLEKYLSQSYDVWAIFGLVQIGYAVGTLPFAWGIAEELHALYRTGGLKALGVVGLNECIDFFALIFFITAIAGGPVTLVSSFAALQPLVVLIITTTLSVFIPRVLVEEIGGTLVARKFFAVATMLIGALLVIR